MTRLLYQALASKVGARINCAKSGNDEWHHRHMVEADTLVRDLMPRGSGFDSGTTLDWDRSTGEKLVFNTAFHHMNEHGYYDGWTEHTVTVRASLQHGGFTLTVGGRDRKGIKDYIAETFELALAQAEPKHIEEVANG